MENKKYSGGGSTASTSLGSGKKKENGLSREGSYKDKNKSVCFDPSVAMSLGETTIPIKQVSKHHYLFRRGSTEVHIATYDVTSASDVINFDNRTIYHDAFKFFSCVEAMLIIIITLVIKLSAILSNGVDKHNELEYMLTMYVVCFVWALYYNLKGFFIHQKCLLFSKSHESSNRWLKGVVVLFGLAIILKDSLQLIAALMVDLSACEISRLLAAKIVFHSAFIITQVNYLIKFSKVYIRDSPASSRMGLMLIIAANLSSWIGAVIDEALIALSDSEDIHLSLDSLSTTAYGDNTGSNTTVGTSTPSSNQSEKDPDCVCHSSFCEAAHVAEKFLFPFEIEFSLVASCLLVMTWSNIGKNPPPCEGVVKPSHKLYKSYTGLVLGILAVFATTIVVVLLGTSPAEAEVHLTETLSSTYPLNVYSGFLIAIESCMLLACLVGFYLFSRIPRAKESAAMLDNILLIICVLGPLALNLFSLVAVIVGPEHRNNLWELTLIQPFSDILLSFLQLTFIMFGLQREPKTSEDAKETASDLMEKIQYQLNRANQEENSANSGGIDNTSYIVTSQGEVTNTMSALANDPEAELHHSVMIDSCNDDVFDETVGIEEDVRSHCTSASSGIASQEGHDDAMKPQRRKRTDTMLSRLEMSLDKLKTKEAILKIVTETRVARPDRLRLWLRDVIMFLLLANACLWVFFSLDGVAFQIHLYQSTFFGSSAWTTIVMICKPLNVFFRMHSTGCLFELWSFA